MLVSALPGLLLGLLSLQVAVAAPSTSKDPKHHGGHGHEGLCSARIVALATAIHLNIVAQYAELNQTEALITLESAHPNNTIAIYEGIGALVADINGGIHIREFIQEIIPSNNAALAGITKYAKAQLVELGLASSLTSVPEHDIPILKTIKGDVMAGIKLNEQNEADAIEGCSLGIVFPPAE